MSLTDERIDAIWAELPPYDGDYKVILDFARAIEQEVTKPQEPVYAYRRKGFDEFVTCDDARYEELSRKPNLFEMAIFYTAPQPCQRCADHVNEIKILKDEIDRLNAIKLARFNNEECWIWQGDGEDNLDSLVCPVVIKPQALAELINRCASLDHQVSEGHKNTLRLESVIRDFEAQTKELEAALAAKTADFDRLCKDFDRLLSGSSERELELMRTIASLNHRLLKYEDDGK